MYQSLLLVLNILCFFGNIYEFNGFMKKRFENCWDWRTFPPPLLVILYECYYNYLFFLKFNEYITDVKHMIYIIL